MPESAVGKTLKSRCIVEQVDSKQCDVDISKDFVLPAVGRYLKFGLFFQLSRVPPLIAVSLYSLQFSATKQRQYEEIGFDLCAHAQSAQKPLCRADKIPHHRSHFQFRWKFNSFAGGSPSIDSVVGSEEHREDLN